MTLSTTDVGAATSRRNRPATRRHPMSMIDAVAIATAAALLLIAGLHVYWALGGRWPGRDAASLDALVVGSKPGSAMPPAPLTFAVGLGLAVIAAGTLAARALIAVPAPDLVRVATWLTMGVLAVRGAGGFLETRLRPHVRALPYARWNVRVYSPLCLALAAGLAVSLAV